MSTVSEFVDREIQVAGLTNFPENRWREAILYYLFGLWAGKASVVSRPKIIFGGLTLRLDKEGKRYFAYGKGADRPQDMALYSREGDEAVFDSQLEVENGLIRFVKNDRIRVLHINVQGGPIALWKKSKRGEYGCCSSPDLPRSWEGLGASAR